MMLIENPYNKQAKNIIEQSRLFLCPIFYTHTQEKPFSYFLTQNHQYKSTYLLFHKIFLCLSYIRSRQAKNCSRVQDNVFDMIKFFYLYMVCVCVYIAGEVY